MLRRMRSAITHRWLCQSGFSLLEAMVALVVLSVGLLAVAAMQDMAMTRNMDANQLSLVTNLASDMVERIRFNARNVTAYSGIDTSNTLTRPPATQPMARGDYDQWAARLTASGLSGVQGLVTVTSVGPMSPPLPPDQALNQNLVTVQVVWSGPIRNRALVLNTVVIPDE